MQRGRLYNFVVRSTLTLIEGQHRLRAMLAVMDVILPLVQHLHHRHHTLLCQFKTSKQISSIGLFWNEFDRWCWCFVETSCFCKTYSAMQPVVCMQSKQCQCTFIFSCKTINFQQIDKLICFLLLDFDWHCLASGSLLSLSQIAPDLSALNQIVAPLPAPAMPPTGSIQRGRRPHRLRCQRRCAGCRAAADSCSCPSVGIWCWERGEEWMGERGGER